MVKTWMRCGLVVTVAVLALVGTGVNAQETGETGPKLVIGERIKDFGAVAQGVVLETSIELRNTGDAPLVISAVRPTCGCTVVEFDREIAPGATGKIDAKLDTTGFRGQITKSVFIISNDAQDQTASVVLKADVQPFLDLMPRPLVKFNVVQYETATDKMILVGGTDQDFKVTDIKTSAPYLTATSRELEESELLPGMHEDQYEISVTLGEDAPPGALKGTVEIFTDHPKAPHIVAKVFGIVRALIHVTPTHLQFGSVDPSLNLGRNVILVNNRPDQVVEVTGAEVDDPAFTTEVVAVEEGRRYQIMVKVNPDADPGSRDATLTIRTTDPLFPEVVVPVRASIQ